ncbi:MAG: High-affinity nickel-transporter [Actinobacteria bacterium]|nr:High-affinity nickel-transporter [Actinomycetota bacterium]
MIRRTLLAFAVAAAVLLAPATAMAHPLGNFTVNRYAGIQVTPGQVRIDYVVDMAEIPTVQVRPQVDADDDGVISDAERSAWAANAAAEIASNLALTIDREPVALEVVSAAMRLRPGQGGLEVLRLEATFAGPAPETGALAFTDGNFEDRVGWREITATGADGVAITGSDVPVRSVTDGLLSYPQDLLSSPIDVRDASVSFEPGSGGAVLGDGVGETAGAGAGRLEPVAGAFAGLVGRTGPFMAVALLLAFAFGAMHALGPGHGKTLMAAYLVGAGGRVRHAVAVGGSVAVMHTASVLALGFVVLTLTEFFAPERVYPWLGLTSGVIALALGAMLLVSRLSRWSTTAGADERVHDHEHGPGHGPEHGPAHDGPLSRRSLTALAVAGGILPSPTAMVVLLAAIALGRVAYGLALIAAFSLGLAGTLVVVGIVALRAGDALSRRVSGRAARLVPVVSAAAIALLGLVLTLRGFAQV